MILEIIFDREKLQGFFDAISKGFAKDPVKSSISILIILFLIIVTVIVIKIINKKKERINLKELKKRFQNTVERKNLSPNEKEILLSMADFINNKKHLIQIFNNPTIFTYYSNILLNSQLVTEKEIAILRIKLGLSQKTILNRLYSTADLSIGTPVKVSLLKNYFKGIISNIDETGVSININSNFKFDKNTEIIIEFDNNYGFFLIHSHILEINNNIIKVEHSEKIEKFQKRKFFRKNIRLPIIIKKNQEDKGIHSYLLDLSGGGAKIYNPELNYKIGEKLLITILLNKDEELKVNSIIKRLSKSDSSMSVIFTNIKESIRDKIIKAILH